MAGSRGLNGKRSSILLADVGQKGAANAATGAAMTRRAQISNTRGDKSAFSNIVRDGTPIGYYAGGRDTDATAQRNFYFRTKHGSGARAGRVP